MCVVIVIVGVCVLLLLLLLFSSTSSSFAFLRVLLVLAKVFPKISSCLFFFCCRCVFVLPLLLSFFSVFLVLVAVVVCIVCVVWCCQQQKNRTEKKAVPNTSLFPPLLFLCSLPVLVCGSSFSLFSSCLGVWFLSFAFMFYNGEFIPSVLCLLLKARSGYEDY